LDYDPTHRRVFANKSHGPLGPSYNAQTVVVYPMVPWVGEEGDYFPAPLGTFQARSSIVILVIDSFGETLLLGTERGAIEIWDVSMSTSGSAGKFRRLLEVKVVQCLRRSIDEWIADRVQVLRSKSIESKIAFLSDGDRHQASSSSPTVHDEHDDSSTGSNTGNESSPLTEEMEISFKVLRRQPDLPVFQANVDHIFLPKHLSLEKAGLVTLQHHPVEGSSLLLWRKQRDGELKVVSLINLRLSSRQKPRIHYDGNRLIVFGQDHIGVIILVYHVANGDNLLPKDDVTATGEHSGGVYNLTDPPQIRFANRIRHAALGGIDRLDTIHMTANERFIIVNTKTGNLLGEATSSLSEGLLVINLQEQGESNESETSVTSNFSLG
jgi:hypothetical protein